MIKGYACKFCDQPFLTQAALNAHTCREPKEKATLLFVITSRDILLIHKKRGIGKGLWNGPGGHIEEGETPEQAAIREFEEETEATPLHVEAKGFLDFYILDEDFSMRVWIFTGDGVDRMVAKETKEAFPCWFRHTDIPYGKMWMDDRLWLPHVLKGRSVHGKITMREKSITCCEIGWKDEAIGPDT
jgi:8-oxo-dGTP diphosphatase